MNKTIAMLAAIALLLVCQVNSLGTIEEKEITSPRKLGFDFNVNEIFDIGGSSFSVAGQRVFMKYKVAVQNGKAINQIIIQTNQRKFKFGNNGVDSETNKSLNVNMRILTFRFPPMPTITLGLIVKGSLSYTIKYASASKDSLQMTLTGDLKAGIEVVSGPGGMSKILTGAEGTLISSSGYATVTKNDIYKGFKFSGTKVYAWVEARAKIPSGGEKTLWKETINFSTWWSTYWHN